MALTRISSDQIEPGSITAELLAPGAGAGPVIANVQIANSSYSVLDDTAVALDGGYIILNGSNFGSNTQVIIGNSIATSVTYVSATEIRAQVPAKTAGSYIVYLVNTDTGATAIRVNAVTYSGVPTWSTGSSLTEGAVDEAISIQLSATSDTSVTYQLQTGSTLPSGLSLSANGLLSGTVTGLNEDIIYNFTIKAVDVENQESPRSFSITITAGDPNINSVVLALNADSNTFITDASTNSFAITPVGDTRPSAFSPYNTSWSNFFDGNGDQLYIASAASLTLGAGDFTIEFWYSPTDLSAQYKILADYRPGTTQGLYPTILTHYAVVVLYFNTGFQITGTTSLQVGNWYHIAVTKSGSSTKLFVNGIQDGSTLTDNNTYIGNTFYISGNGFGAGFSAHGYISNFRIVKGTAVYTSNFTPPTAPFTAISGTSLLTCQSNRLIDNSTNNFTITRNGDVKVTAFAPFVDTDTTTGSGYFDGSEDYLRYAVNTSSEFSLGTSNFTDEAWIFPTAFNAGSTIISVQTQISGTAGNGYSLYLNGSGQPGVLVAESSGAYVVNFLGTAIPLNAWTHLAVTRNGNTFTLWRNGVSGGTATSSATITQNTTSGYGGWNIGGSPQTGQVHSGYISNARLVKGTAVYTSNFTPPTAPVTAIANTSLLTLQNRISYNNSQPIDESGIKNIITRAGNASVGSYTPHTPAGWSAYFDGTMDYLRTTSTLGVASNEFTIGFWFYPLSSSVVGLFDSGPNVANCFRNWPGNVITDQNTTPSVSLAGAYTVNAWNWMCITKSGTSFTVYINGTFVGTGTCSNPMAESNFTIGAINGGGEGSYNGYISNFIFVNNSASEISVPTSPLTVISGTSFLTLRGASFTDDGPNRFAITINGDTRITPFSPFKTHTITPDSHSVFFDGSDDHFTIADSENLQLGSGNFTIEGWFYPTKAGTPVCFYTKGVNTTGGIILGVSTTLILLRHTGVTDTYASVSISEWNHIAWVRSGNTISIYVNGVAQSVVNSTVGFNQNDTTTAFIGSPTNIAAGANRYGGYASNFRIIKGTALYTGNFTPSTTPLTKTSQGALTSEVELLTCQSSTIVDNSDNNFTLTVVNQPQPTRFNPFGETVTEGIQYSPASHGGSYYFDGTGDYLNTPATGQFAPTGTFTIECFVYINSLAAIRTIIGNYTTNAATDWMIDVSTAGVLRAYTNGSTARISSASGAVTISQWFHIVLSRNSSNVISLFLNGVLIGTYSQSGIFGSAAKVIYIGVQNVSTNLMLGYISNLRMVESSALYTSAFVPPSAPPLPVAGTTLLLNGTNAAIPDGVGKNVLETVGNARVVNGVRKYGTGAMYFDGTGDGLLVKNTSIQSFGTGNFTIECWMNTTATSGTADLFGQLDSGSSIEPVLIRNAGILYWQTNYGATNLMNSGASGLFDGSWHHVAMVRYNGVSRVYLDGTSIMNANDTTNYTSVGDIGVGAIGATYGDYLGYIDDFRITKGIARYTANFTPPTLSFKLK